MIHDVIEYGGSILYIQLATVSFLYLHNPLYSQHECAVVKAQQIMASSKDDGSTAPGVWEVLWHVSGHVTDDLRQLWRYLLFGNAEAVGRLEALKSESITTGRCSPEWRWRRRPAAWPSSGFAA